MSPRLLLRPLRAAARLSLLRNSGFLMGTTVMTSALGYAYWLIAAHSWSSSTVGFAAGAISTFTLVGFVFSLGVAPAYVQMLPRFTDAADLDQFFSSGLVTTTAASLVAGVVVVTVLPQWAPHFHELRQGSVAAAFVAGCGLSTTCVALDGCFVALRRSSGQFGRNVVFAVAKIGLLLLPVLVLRRPGPASILWTWDAALLASAIVAIVMLERLGMHLAIPRRSGLRRLFVHRHTMLGYQLGSLGASLPPFVFPALVIAILGTRQNAYVYFTWSIAGILFTVSTSIGLALFAEGAHREDLRRQTRLAATTMTAVLVPLTALMLVFAGQILSVFGHEYATRGTMLLRIFAIGALADAVTNCYVGIRNAQHRLIEVAVLNFVIAAIALGGSAALLRRWGIDAVGWSWMAAQATGCVWVAVMALRGAIHHDGDDHHGDVRDGASVRAINVMSATTNTTYTAATAHCTSASDVPPTSSGPRKSPTVSASTVQGRNVSR
jgi:O-antigen/teichoic acid export membrane protein